MHKKKNGNNPTAPFNGGGYIKLQEEAMIESVDKLSLMVFSDNISKTNEGCNQILFSFLIPRR